MSTIRGGAPPLIPEFVLPLIKIPEFVLPLNKIPEFVLPLIKNTTD